MSTYKIDKNKKNLMIVHSYNGDTNNLRPWIWDTCDKLWLSRCMPELRPIREEATFKSWSKIMDVYRELGLLNENSMVIAHSLGTLFIVKYLAQREMKLKNYVSLAGFVGEVKERPDINSTVYNGGFMPTDEEFSIARDLIKEKTAMFDKEDHLLTEKQLFDYANKIEAEIQQLSGYGHFGNGTGVTEIPELQAKIETYNKTL